MRTGAIRYLFKVSLYLVGHLFCRWESHFRLSKDSRQDIYIFYRSTECALSALVVCLINFLSIDVLINMSTQPSEISGAKRTFATAILNN